MDRKPFVDETMMIHNWNDYAGQLIQARQRNTDRMRLARAAHVRRTDIARAGATVPNPTVPGDGGEVKTSPAHQISEDQSIWPVWYSLLWGIEGFKMSFEIADTWRLKTGISEDLAERKSYAIREWWPRQPKKRRQGGDPYRTWQRFCREDRAKDNHQQPTDETAVDPNEDPQRALVIQEAKEWKEMRERRAKAQRQSVQPSPGPQVP